MTYLADPGNQFDTDAHRRVLAHLSIPSDEIAWPTVALFLRMVKDVGTNFQSPEEVQAILNDLEEQGHAQRLTAGSTEVWKMTTQGFDLLTGPANVPEGGEVRAALINVEAGAVALDQPVSMGDPDVVSS